MTIASATRPRTVGAAILLSSVWLSLASRTASADAVIRSGALTGLRNFSIVIENLQPAAARCGVTKNRLETDLRFVLGQSGLVIADQGPTDGIIYLNVTMLDNCAANVELEVMAGVTINVSARRDTAYIWQDGGLTYSEVDPGRAIDSWVDRLVKELVIDWNCVNRRP